MGDGDEHWVIMVVTLPTTAEATMMTTVEVVAVVQVSLTVMVAVAVQADTQLQLLYVVEELH